MQSISNFIQNRNSLNYIQRVLVLLVAVTLVGTSVGRVPVSARSAGLEPLVVTPQITSAPILAGTTQTINNGPGNQTSPSVDCNLAAYANDDFMGTSLIRYFDFSTNTDHVVPGNGLDLLADAVGGRIAFTEVISNGDQIVVFDLISQTRTVIPGADEQAFPVLGGELVAFTENSFNTNGNQSEIAVYDLSTGTYTHLTNDNLPDKFPAISPSGNAVVWEKCQTNDTSCDIYASIQTAPGVFSSNELTGAAGDERFPATNGQIVAYTSTRAGETDVYFQPVTGGTETQLSIPDIQRDVSISGNLISFESQVQLNGQSEFDVFVYNVSTGSFYRVTNTPDNETLSDISVCDGVGRIVFAIPGAGDFDLYAFTFQAPGSYPNEINDLIALIHSFSLPVGITNSLVVKLQNALTAINASDTPTACSSLTAFINEVRAQSGKKLTVAQASQLINAATGIKSELGCQ